VVLRGHPQDRDWHATERWTDEYLIEHAVRVWGALALAAQWGSSGPPWAWLVLASPWAGLLPTHLERCGSKRRATHE
jgi:hypothetical protein